MKFVLFGILFLINFQFTSPPLHNFYLGLIEIDKKNITEPTKITIRVFADDLENCLRNEFSEFKKVSGNEFCNAQFSLIERYFSNHFQIKINEELQVLNFQSCRKEKEIFWLKFEISDTENWESVEVFADFFMELFPDQSNVVSVYFGEKMGHCRLVKNYEKEILNFN